MLLPTVHSGADPLQGVPARTSYSGGVWTAAALLDNEALRNAYSSTQAVELGAHGDVARRRLPHDYEEFALPEDVHYSDRTGGIRMERLENARWEDHLVHIVNKI